MEELKKPKTIACVDCPKSTKSRNGYKCSVTGQIVNSITACDFKNSRPTAEGEDETDILGRCPYTACKGKISAQTISDLLSHIQTLTEDLAKAKHVRNVETKKRRKAELERDKLKAGMEYIDKHFTCPCDSQPRGCGDEPKELCGLKQIVIGYWQPPALQPKCKTCGGSGLKPIKYQSCGCVICSCEDEIQCQGCGAKHCDRHKDGLPNPESKPCPDCQNGGE
jgi:hypothetical protein